MSENDDLNYVTKSSLTIPRPRIQARLASAMNYRITMIVAPAGFGKSAALRELIRNQTAILLYTVSPNTATLVEFVRGLCDALSGRIPTLRASLASAIDSNDNATNPGKELANWVNAHLDGSEHIIAIDNLEICIANRDVSLFLLALTDLTKGSVKWILSSRGLTGLPTTSWFAYQDMDAALDADDLRFDRDEIEASAALGDIALNESQLEKLSNFTQGWPVAIGFAMRTLPKTNDLESLAGKTGDMMYRFLADQVWRSLSEDARAFLYVATFLPNINLETVSAAGYDDDLLLEQLQTHVGLLIVGTGLYELHRLFKDFIAARLRNMGEMRVRQARHSAGTILESMGKSIDALEQFIEASSILEVERLLTLHNFSLFDSGHIDTVERAIQVLEGTGSETACALRAGIEEARGRVASAEILYARALESTHIDLTFRVAITWRYSLMLYQQRRTDAIPMLSALCERSELTDFDRAQVTGSLAVLLAFSGDHGLAQDAVARAIALTHDAGGPLRARTLGRASTVAFFLGDNESVERFAREAAHIAEECSMFTLSARIKTSLSTLNTSAGNISVAAFYAAQVIKDAERAGDIELRVRGLRELIVLEAERGDETSVAALEGQLATTLYDGPVGLIGLIVARGMRLIWNSQFLEAVRALSNVPPGDLSWHQHRVRIALLAVANFSMGHAENAAKMFASYDIAMENDTIEHAMFDRERALSLRYMSLAALLAADRRRARTYRNKVARLDLAGSAFDAALDAVASRSRNSLESALMQLERMNQGGVAAVIRATSASLFSEHSANMEALTPTETSVLRALSEGSSNKAIADANGRTVNTVRSQVSSILKKLECSSRGEAVALARKLNII